MLTVVMTSIPAASSCSTSSQRFGRHVHELDLLGLAHHCVGNGLVLLDPGDLLDDVVHRLEVLDVDGGDDVDAGVQQRVDVLPTLLVGAARSVRVRQFVDEGDLGTSRQHRLEVHLLEPGTAILSRDSGHHLEVAHLGRGEGAVVSLDVTNNDVGAPLATSPTLVQHAVGLAHSGG
jgi:hypothetical protein